jgi:hypothetical protein
MAAAPGGGASAAAAAASAAATPPIRVAAVAGYGPGISASFARRLGRDGGFALALFARSPAKLREGEEALKAAGVRAPVRGFAVDLADEKAVAAGFQAAADALKGPIEVVHWNPYNTLRAPLLELAAGGVDELTGVAVKGLLAAVRACAPGWEAMNGPDAAQAGAAAGAGGSGSGSSEKPSAAQQQKQRPALLVTGGGLALPTTTAARRALEWGIEGIAIAKAAQHKCVALLREALRERGVFVGQVTVDGVVRGTAFGAERKDECGGDDECVADEGDEGGEGGGGSGACANNADDEEAAAAADSLPAVACFSPDDVAEALWKLCVEQPAGDDEWHVVLDSRGAR